MAFFCSSPFILWHHISHGKKKMRGNKAHSCLANVATEWPNTNGKESEYALPNPAWKTGLVEEGTVLLPTPVETNNTYTIKARCGQCQCWWTRVRQNIIKSETWTVSWYGKHQELLWEQLSSVNKYYCLAAMIKDIVGKDHTYSDRI